MTIPWMMNCPHRDHDWCLSCTSALGEQLAAKDAEIAELRKHRDAAVQDYTRMQEIALQAESERDEARECVGRLYPLAGMWADQLAHEAKQPMTGSKARKLAAELDEARAALAATPEHLR